MFLNNKNSMKRILSMIMLLVAVTTGAWAGEKTVVKYSFDDATSPSLTLGNKSAADYSYTSVISSTKFLNIYDSANNTNGTTAVSLTNDDLSSESWTLSFYWSGLVGGNGRGGFTELKAGDTQLFNIADAASYGGSMALTYGPSGSESITLPNTTKAIRMTKSTATAYNTTDYWLLFTITGTSKDGVKMTIRNADSGDAIVSDAVLSATNVTPTVLNLRPGCLGAIGLDELSLSYYVEGEVIQTPTASYTAVDGINRTITATCDTEGATIQYSTDGVNYTAGASVTVSESGNVYFKAVKNTSESDVLTFAAVAGEAITLNAPTIVRSNNTTVTITADQTDKLLSPTVTITYEYGNEKGSFTGSKVLTVAADATITAYAEATGYTKSATSERAVTLFPTNVEAIENTPTITSGWSTGAFSDETKTVSDRTYAAYLLDDVQWGTNVYLQKDGAWGIRNSGNWYINATTASWILMPNMKAGDIVVSDINYAASNMVNATYSKYSYGNRHAYEVTADGDVELAFNKIDASTMDYLYGFYAYRTVTSVPASIGEHGYATFSSTYALDFSKAGVEAYIATGGNETTVTMKKVDGTVAANTGLVLKGAAGNYNIPVVASGTAYNDNKLWAITNGQTVTKADEGYTNYVLAWQNSKVVFAPVGENSASLPAGSAALSLPNPNSARAINLVFGGITGINEAAASAEAALKDGKYVEAGKVVIYRNGKKFNATGAQMK